MRAHSAVLSGAIEVTTVLPLRFGIVLPSDEAVAQRILKPQYERFAGYLAELDGTVELTLRANHVEERALEVVAERPLSRTRRNHR